MDRESSHRTSHWRFRNVSELCVQKSRSRVTDILIPLNRPGWLTGPYSLNYCSTEAFSPVSSFVFCEWERETSGQNRSTSLPPSGFCRNRVGSRGTLELIRIHGGTTCRGRVACATGKQRASGRDVPAAQIDKHEWRLRMTRRVKKLMKTRCG
jgi:hypothetical protein